MAYPTLQEIKDFLGITDSDDDAWLDQVRVWTEELIHKYLGRNLNLSEYTQEYYQLYSNSLHLNNFPAVDIVSITIDEVAKDIADFHLNKEAGILYGELYHGDLITVVYNGGYQPLPGVVLDCFYSIIEDRYNQYKGESSEDDIKVVTLFDFAKVGFDTGSGSQPSNTNAPAYLYNYLGMLDLYKASSVMLGADGVR